MVFLPGKVGATVVKAVFNCLPDKTNKFNKIQLFPDKTEYRGTG